MSPTEQRLLTINNVGALSFGSGAALRCAGDIRDRGAGSVFLVTTKPTLPLCEPLADALRSNGCAVTVWHDMVGEPTIAEFKNALDAARRAHPEAVIGLGGGSAMDVAKLVAAFADTSQTVEQAFGVDKLLGRSLWLACIPTTAGTGSEVTPIEILGDPEADLKKGVVSRARMASAAITVQRLLERNLRLVTEADAIEIYKAAW